MRFGQGTFNPAVDIHDWIKSTNNTAKINGNRMKNVKEYQLAKCENRNQ